MLAGLDSILLCRQPKTVVPDRMQNIETLMPLDPRIDITGNISQRMPYMKTCSGRIRKHVKNIKFRSGGTVRGFEGLVVFPEFLPFFLYLLVVVEHCV